MTRYRGFALIVALVVGADQVTKLAIVTYLEPGQAIAVVDNFFHIVSVRNPGAAFGILADSHIRVPFFIGVALLAMAGILWYLRRLPPGRPGQTLALALIFSGALGNLIDRVRLGEVIDFLDVHWHNYHWPAFNLADSSICVGVAIVLYCSWREESHAQKT